MRQFTTRRGFLQLGTAAATVGIAGCTLPGTDGSTARLDSTDNLGFDDVDDDFRRRTERVYERVVDIVGRELESVLTIRIEDANGDDERTITANEYGQTRTQQAILPALAVTDDDTYTMSTSAGGYYPQSELVTFGADGPGEIPDELIAHELLHAIQSQTNDFRDAQSTREFGFDRQWARTALVEGTAQYLEAVYADGCDGDPCQLSDPSRPRTEDLDPVSALNLGSYVNGHHFAAALADRGGWDAIWDAHENHPTHTGQILRPEWYPDRDPADVAVADRSTDDWTLLGRERLGMQSVFATLWLAGVLPHDEAYIGDTTAEAVVGSRLVRYRSDVTDAWRGDAFAAFERDDGSEGWLWRIRWADSTAAADALEAFQRRAAERGAETDEDDVWTRNGSYETVVRDGEDVLIGFAPDRDALESLSPALVA